MDILPTQATYKTILARVPSTINCSTRRDNRHGRLPNVCDCLVLEVANVGNEQVDIMVAQEELLLLGIKLRHHAVPQLLDAWHIKDSV